MTQYWSMKTYSGWWDVFRTDNVIGVDEEGAVDTCYRTLSDAQIQSQINTNAMSEYVDRTFREFVHWMQIGDLILVGVGQTTKFNLAAVGKVTGDYCFDANRPAPRHFRTVKFLAEPLLPKPMQRFARTSRLELIHETDFHEAILSLIT